ncbi:hypothetical protein SAMN05446635_1601 [Burkholderia sp. OK233]|nr:hypothetical protein SAMN05446635_1601 [Burkholderia sp. OK233]
MNIRYIPALRCAAALASACVALGGCVQTTPLWDSHFGDAVRTVTQAQIIDPDAATRNPSTNGVDGKAAVAAMANYNASFQQPAPSANAFVIGVGGSGSGAAMAAPSGSQ